MSEVLPLAARWLAAHGADDPYVAAQVGAARAARYPAPVGAAWPSVVDGLDRLAPLLVLGRPGRASQLDREAFDQLDGRLQHHPVRAIRLAWLLARFPLIEARYAEPAPPDPGHPLRALEPVLRERRRLTNDTFDVIVVGTGAGGAPVGRELARAGWNVCFVEAGALLGAEPTGRAVERYYLDQGMFGSADGGGTALVIAGKAVGGTTAINSGTSFRPKPERLEAWDEAAGTSFASGCLDPYLDQLTGELGIGPVPEDLLDASAQLVRLGLETLGRTGAYALPRNAPTCKGAARCCFGCPNGAKLSTDRALLPDAIEAGATLLARTEAVGIRTDASGVDVWVREIEGIRRLRARRLILAAGAVGTPGLLRAHHLGERWRRAGDDLRIHPASKVFGWMPRPLAHGGVPQALGYETDELPRVTFEGAHTPAAVTATLLQVGGPRHRAWMDHHDHLANYGMMIRDRATGRVRHVAGKATLRYALDRADAADLGSALLLAARALFAAGAERVALPLAGGRDPEIRSVAELDALTPADFPREALLTSGFHPQGTAGIGRVVDADLGLVGEPRVTVCDASVLPDSPGVNPQVTIMALSLRLADHLRAREG